MWAALAMGNLSPTMLTQRLRTTTLAMAIGLLLPGCWKATFYRDTHVVRGATHDRWSDFFIFGLIGRERFDVRDFCGSDDVAEVRTGANGGTTLVSVLTLGIYVPRKVYVSCAAQTTTSQPQEVAP